MAGKRGGTVCLSTHKNTLEKRHARQMKQAACADVQAIMAQDVRAYAFVAIDAAGRAHAAWDTGSILPMWAFSSVVADMLRADIEASGVEETWRPNLNERGRPDGAR